jgi:hypothetical protein
VAIVRFDLDATRDILSYKSPPLGERQRGSDAVENLPAHYYGTAGVTELTEEGIEARRRQRRELLTTDERGDVESKMLLALLAGAALKPLISAVPNPKRERFLDAHAERLAVCSAATA